MSSPRAMSTAREMSAVPDGSLDLRSSIRFPRPEFGDAYRPVSFTGDTIQHFQNLYDLIDWDMLYFLGFTNYRDLQDYKREHELTPIGQDRELLVRLMFAHPRPSALFNPPDVKVLAAFVFNLSMTPNKRALKRCMPFMAQIFGRDKVSGYRWARGTKPTSGDQTTLSIRRAISKVFSIALAEVEVREMFWTCVFAMLTARATDDEKLADLRKLTELLQENNVRIPKLAA